ncbi:uncharacterized protein [Ptychodera flava]|uniref:uncharacterized protein n=1 Tax=Ptychodera flava TaxID=63121 RepID=UPI00396AA502
MANEAKPIRATEVRHRRTVKGHISSRTSWLISFPSVPCFRGVRNFVAPIDYGSCTLLTAMDSAHVEVGRRKSSGKMPIADEYITDSKKRRQFLSKHKQGLKRKVNKLHVCTHCEVLLYIKSCKETVVYGSTNTINKFKSGTLLVDSKNLEEIEKHASSSVQPPTITPKKPKSASPHMQMFASPGTTKKYVLSRDTHRQYSFSYF